MIHVGMNLEMDPDLVTKLSAGQKLCYASHDDGSKNKINGDVVLEASTYGTGFGILAALFMGIRKKFRNRGKTKEDLAAEKEAARINRTCGALEVMLPEYLKSTREGTINEEALDELIETLDEIHGYAQAGKLIVPNQEEMTEIRKSIEKYTEAIAKSKSAPLNRKTGTGGADEFQTIRELLAQQKELLQS